MRSKCVHEKGKAPCQSCLDAGIAAEHCQFPVRGQPDEDRDFRHPRMRSEKSQKRRDPTKSRRSILDDSPMHSPTSLIRGMPGTPMAVDEWDQLPPLDVIIDAVHKFTRHYFQLGFIHKQAFPERLRTNPRTVSPFFLLSLLSVSSRLTPSLVVHYGSAVQAADSFMERASRVALTELYKEASLERCQAFYLLSIAQQGSGMKYQSSINLGIAVRLATLMQLHREETYALVNPSKELIVQAESARRTLWMLHSQDNLHSGPRSPMSLAASDITTLLPCNEAEFANAEQPKERAALEDTPPAKEAPRLVALKNKSLFATLIQSHYHWGTISRRAFSQDKGRPPWEKASEYAKMEKRLKQWEDELPPDHRWSDILLKGHKQHGQDLAYLGVTMITRLSNIVIRKAYLREMINHDKADRNSDFWVNMAHELWVNVEQLFDQITTQWADRAEGEGMGGQMAAFCIYSCGFLASYFCKYTQLCSDRNIPFQAAAIVSRILLILEESKGIWPLASGWYEHLDQFHRSPAPPAAIGITAEQHSMADSVEPIPHVLHHPSHNKPLGSPDHESKNGVQSQTPGSSAQPSSPPMHIDPSLRLPPVPQPTFIQQQQPPLPPQQQPQQPQNMPTPSPVQQTVPTQVQVQAQQAMAAVRPHDGLGLLIEASATFDSHSGPHVTGPGVPTGQPYDPHTAGQGYFPPPAMGASDGYEDQMQTLYLDHISGQAGGMSNWPGVQNMNNMAYFYGQPS
ncbi:hypothetical protein QBC39DRAFT_363766 [Podospora conica]|nr:hypothetical protein QBC39DRAFT_363766 [Schizothecium conicum]